MDGIRYRVTRYGREVPRKAERKTGLAKKEERKEKIVLTVFPILIPQRFVKQLFKIDLGEDVNKAGYTALGAPKHLYKRVNKKA